MHYSQLALSLLSNKKCTHVLGDRAYDSNNIRSCIASIGAEAVIPSCSRRKEQYEYDKTKYKQRNCIERFFSKLKHFRGIATRYMKRGLYFFEAVMFAAFIIGTRIVDSS